MRSLTLAVLATALVLGADTPARAQTPEVSLTIESAIEEALASNRDFLSAQVAIDVAEGRVVQAGRLDNPEFAWEWRDDFAFKAEGERSLSAGLAQRFPVTARLGHERTVAQKDVDIARAEVHDFARTLIGEVQRAFFRIRALDARIDVNGEIVGSTRAAEELVRARIRAAEASPADLGLLRLERMRLEQQGARLQRERGVGLSELARLLGRETAQGLVPAGDLDPGEPASDNGDWKARPDFEAARVAIERAEADHALARVEPWEDWTLAIGLERERAPFDQPIGTERDTSLALGVTIPVPLWDRRPGRIASAEAELRRRRRTRDGLALRIREEVTTAQLRVAQLRGSIDTFTSEILPEATRTKQLYERGYVEGLAGVSDLLQAQRQYNESRAAYFELLGELREAAVTLEAATGVHPALRPLGVSGGSVQ